MRGQKVLYPSVRLARLWNKSRSEMHARLYTNKSKSFVLLGLLANEALRKVLSFIKKTMRVCTSSRNVMDIAMPF